MRVIVGSMSGPSYVYHCIVERVVDGDTVDVRIDLGFSVWIAERVRIAGIDAPGTRTVNAREKVRGVETMRRVEELLPAGGSVVVQTEQERGKFGRVLGNFVLPYGVTVAEVLLSERLAVAYRGQAKAEVAAEHEANWAYRELLEAEREEAADRELLEAEREEAADRELLEAEREEAAVRSRPGA